MVLENHPGCWYNKTTGEGLVNGSPEPDDVGVGKLLAGILRMVLKNQGGCGVRKPWARVWQMVIKNHETAGVRKPWVGAWRMVLKNHGVRITRLRMRACMIVLKNDGYADVRKLWAEWCWRTTGHGGAMLLRNHGQQMGEDAPKSNCLYI